MSATGIARPITAGVVTALVGFTGAFTVVLAGLTAVGASPAQAASGLLAVSVTMGVSGVLLAWWTRIPMTIAWSTPGAGLLAATGVVEGGWPAAVGASRHGRAHRPDRPHRAARSSHRRDPALRSRRRCSPACSCRCASGRSSAPSRTRGRCSDRRRLARRAALPAALGRPARVRGGRRRDRDPSGDDGERGRPGRVRTRRRVHDADLDRGSRARHRAPAVPRHDGLAERPRRRGAAELRLTRCPGGAR